MPARRQRPTPRLGLALVLCLAGAAHAQDFCDMDLVFDDGFEAAAATLAACADGLDNDGDGATDHPADPGCCTNRDANELGASACDDGLDNDEDGLIDYRIDGSGDPGCTDPSDDSEVSTPECSDGIDNDFDGKIDFNPNPGAGDPQCSSPADPSESS